MHEDNYYSDNWKVAEKGEKVMCAQSSLATSKSLHDQREVLLIQIFTTGRNFIAVGCVNWMK